jgi:hypothetical protein
VKIKTASAGKGPITCHRSPRGLGAKAASACRALGSQMIWKIWVKTPRRVRSWINQLWITRSARTLSWAKRVRANEGVCSIEIANKHVGFFAQMIWCLHILQYCQRHGLIPDIRLTGETYLDQERGPNWLDYYFDNTYPMTSEEVARRVQYTKKIVEFEEIGLPFAPKMSLDDGSRVLHKYLRLKSHIEAMVDDFWRPFSAGDSVVGVHFRGTDKAREAPRVSWAHCLTILTNYLRNHDTFVAVFVASDEEAFIDFIKTSVKDVPVYSRDDHYRSTDNRPVHTKVGEGTGYKRGEDALVNALLLSRCSTLLRTTSFLSAWASIFNPNLKVILLNRPYDDKLWYPECEIIGRPDTEYMPER